MRLRALVLAALLAWPCVASAADNAVVITPGVGVTMRTKDIGGGVQSPINIIGDTSGNAIYGLAGTPNSNVLTVQGVTSMTALKVDGSAVTQPVSAASLPLPSGAATSAKQPALGAAGAASADVLTVQGVTSMTPLKVDGSGVTQPVSGTFWQATQPVSASSLPLPTGAATAAKQPALGTAGAASADVITIQGVASMTALKVDGSAVTQPVSAASLPLPAGASTAAKQPALGTAGSPSADVITIQGVVSMTALKVDGSAVTQPVSIASLPALPANQSTNEAQINGVTPLMGNGQTGTGAQRMTLSQDSASAPINVSTATDTQLVALSGSTKIYVTSLDVIAGGAGNITFEYGTGSNCATGKTALTGAYPLTAQAGLAEGDGLGALLLVPAGNALCVLTSAAVQMSGHVGYIQF